MVCFFSLWLASLRLLQPEERSQAVLQVCDNPGRLRGLTDAKWLFRYSSAEVSMRREQASCFWRQRQ